MLLLLFSPSVTGYATVATLADFSVSSTGTVLVQATSTQTLADFTPTATASVLVQGALTATLASFTPTSLIYSPARLCALTATLADFSASSAAYRLAMRGRIASVFARGGKRTRSN